MTLSDRVIDAWAWFTDDPEQSADELYRAARAGAELLMGLWWVLLIAGVVGISDPEVSRRQWLLSLLLGAIGCALWATPLIILFLILEVVL